MNEKKTISDRTTRKSRRDDRLQPATPVAGKMVKSLKSPVGTAEADRLKRAIIKGVQNGCHSIDVLFGKLNRLGRRVAVPVYLDLMTHSDMGVLCEAAKAIPHCAAATRGCIRLLDPSYSVNTRKFAAWALGNTNAVDAIAPLLDLLKRHDDCADVRAHAAEALGVLLMVWGGCRRPVNKIQPGVRRRVAHALIQRLGDPSADVRFWCCYALGSMRAKSALEQLDRLAKNDRGRAKGFGAVAHEARNAAKCIRQGFWPDPD